MSGIIVNIINTEFFTGDDGIDYVKFTKEILTPRKTFVKGEISGKYRGDRLFLDSQRPNMSLFDFEIYEAQVICGSKENFQKNKPFKLSGKIEFPREKLPKNIPVSIQANGMSYDVNILEPSIYDFESIRKYRQVHGDEVYGHFKAYITGYIFDYERHEIVVIEEYVEQILDAIPEPPESPVKDVVVNAGIFKNGYQQVNIYDRAGQIRSRTIYNPQRKNSIADGCLSGVFGLITLVLGILFLIILIPNFFYVILIGGLFMLFYYLAPVLKWIFRIVGAVLLLLFFIGLLDALKIGRPGGYSLPRPLEDEREKVTAVSPEPQPTITPITDENNLTVEKDNLIKRFRSWRDYEGRLFVGYYTVKESDFQYSNAYKKGLRLKAGSMNTYDQIVFNLKEQDKNALSGLYGMLDSIQEANQLPKIKFAEMTVCMVQDIPYSLVLEKDCDARIYNDAFISQWLSKPDGFCDPYQRFGINSPVEFITNLKGDCDTRTLLLYTILSHYGYDVVLLSSEIYKHSLLGINLPLEGTAYHYQGNRYIVWETTAHQVMPGMINPEMANMNYWRISLKSTDK